MDMKWQGAESAEAPARPTILIVEDHLVLSDYMSLVASDLGWQPKTASAVCEFADALAEAHPDVIALDLGLPDGDGLDLLHYLVQARYRGSIFIVSGFDRDILEQCCTFARDLGLNVAGHVQKPISATLLREMLIKSQEQCVA
jgi:CheY-like chemotaxis protein